MSGQDCVLALSIRQPWAWAIVSGHKRIENRCWRTDYRGPLLIHASKGRGGLVRTCRMLEEMGLPVPDPATLACGAIVGRVDLVDCASEITRPELANDRFADAGATWWLFERVEALAEPIPYRGQLNLFRVPRSTIAHATFTPVMKSANVA